MAFQGEIKEIISELKNYPDAIDYQQVNITSGGIERYCNFYTDRFLELIKVVMKNVPLKSKILDIGIGYGVYSKVLKKQGYEITGVELPENISAYRIQSNIDRGIPVIPANIQSEMPFPKNSFDAVIMSEVIEHLRVTPLKPFLKIRDILTENGLLIITTPNFASFRNIICLISGRRAILEPFSEDFEIRESRFASNVYYDSRTHPREYIAKELVELLKKAGYSIENIKMSRCWDGVKYIKYSKKKHNILDMLFYLINSIVTFFCPFWRSNIIIIAKKKQSGFSP